MTELLLGSNNKKKRAEIERILAGLHVVLVSPDGVGVAGEPDESGSTFEENSAIKARFYAAASGMLTLADDSGLVVDALGGRPGVLSSRFAGPDASDGDNCAKLLAEMDEIPDSERTAHFVCAATLASPRKVEAAATGTCEGIILRRAAGSGGFGYDPLFFYPPAGMTFAELPAEIKNKVSHRAMALRRMRAAIERLVTT